METLIDIIKSIIILLKILFFGGSVLLTQSPINIEKEMNINLNQPISALTTGAHFWVDITENIPQDTDFFSGDHNQTFYKRFHTGCIEINLYSDAHKKSIKFFNDRGSVVLLEKSIYLILASKKDVPINIEFNLMMIKTCRPLKNIKITWYNYAK